MATRAEAEAFLNALLVPERFKDYGPNGLQVEGRERIHKVVSGVTASLATDRRCEWLPGRTRSSFTTGCSGVGRTAA
jgi:putative NIF3 family GTP cyclohydrolase 1 type 2